MPNILKNALRSLSSIDGFIAASFVDLDTGMSLDSSLGDQNFDIEVAGAINTNVVQAKLRALETLELVDNIEDIVVSLSTQYHLMRLVPGRPGVFLYLALDRGVANMALARLAMADATDSIASSEIEEIVLSAIEEFASETIAPPPLPTLRTAPSYPRTDIKRADDELPHRKRPGDSPSRAFPRGR